MLNTAIATDIRSIRLPGGVELEYVEQGPPGGLPVVLLHGITDSWRSFQWMLPHLPDALRVFALSQRGHGGSDRPTSGYRVEDLATDVGEFLDRMAIPAAVVVGHSMGSFVAQRFAMDHPSRTIGLGLMGSTISLVGHPAIAEMQTAFSPLVDPIDPVFAREFQAGTAAEPLPPELLDTVVAESLKAPARVWQQAAAGLAEMDHSLVLYRVDAPTLIAWGDRDAMFGRSEQIALQATIAGSRLLVYPGAGHALHWERPVRAALDLSEFCLSLPRRS